MTEVELLAFQDQLRNSLSSISGVAEALSHVGTESTDYCMCQMLANVLKDDIEGIVSTCPEEWDISYPGI
ncbi:hypothetical protein GKE55_11995 [Gordonibacter pamelaeae]|uniref:Uncharacterized protein n=1 Tax=Adlercreutzia hattorii TaxID=2707299 RepID=A0A6F8SJH0_9ACTN|nr:hypothetical protein [Adlercreutzia hattorii]MSA62519.1 hypothetical protein [Gordonibacter pamelaeae]BCA87914.1 hypothetical protein ADCFC_05330 [Adlercreutzia hattorii]